MNYTGVITQIQRSRADVTLIVQTPIGLRGIALDRTLWAQILADFAQPPDATLTGWTVEYDPEHGDLEVIAPPESWPDGTDDTSDPHEAASRREGER
ncbi:MAG: hypothetical protein KBH93_07700 [Anaerolineae bacterium]|nr:hypothetical protein [Anaerolineae bacterium]